MQFENVCIEVEQAKDCQQGHCTSFLFFTDANGDESSLKETL